MSFCLSPKPRNTCRQERWTRSPSQPWHRQPTTGHLPSGKRWLLRAEIILQLTSPLSPLSFQNGSLFIATVQPNFVVLHKLTTSRPPSPLVTLNWHASSSRQKSDMLAVQTLDGDLRVWSISKSHSSDDPAKVVRILKRNETQNSGPNWMAWSKNGRVIQFSES